MKNQRRQGRREERVAPNMEKEKEKNDSNDEYENILKGIVDMT
jgi:hypothetical protein